MALILSLETTGTACSVALHRNGILINVLEIKQRQEHAAQLAVLIDRIVKESGENFKSLEAVSVSSGPGSYTGVRIGTSTAKGICFALGIPLIAIPTLNLLTTQFLNESRVLGSSVLCPMIDAKRMEVYCQVVDQHFNIIRKPEAVVVDEASFPELLEQQTVFYFGDGSDKCKSVIKHSNAVFVEGISPTAAAMGIVSFEKFRKGLFEDLVNFTPFYLKDFIAKKAASVF